MLICKEQAVVVFFGLQKEFIPSLIDGQRLIDDCQWISDLTHTLDIPTLVINHQDLGEPIKAISKVNPHLKTLTSTHFSIWEELSIKTFLEKHNRRHVLLAGAETHIAILQSSFELKTNGFIPFPIIDATTTRNAIDYETAKTRLSHMKIQCISKEMLFFELIRKSTYPNYIDHSLKFLDQRYLRY